MKKILLILSIIFTVNCCFAESIPIIRIENNGNIVEQRTNAQPMKGFRLLEFDPADKSIKKLPDVEVDEKKQNEVQADNIKEEGKNKFNFERMKFDGFEN